MDNARFGAFIAELRKEKGMTQRALADRLSVTDKAVSKWERGLGFPDIKLIEPLADALGSSVIEIMSSERLSEGRVSTDGAAEALCNVIDVAEYQRKLERRNIAISATGAAAVIMTIFLMDTMRPIGFFMVCLPVVLLAVGTVLLILSWKRRRQRLPYAAVLTLAVISLIIPLFFCVLLFCAFLLGGPVPV